MFDGFQLFCSRRGLNDDARDKSTAEDDLFSLNSRLASKSLGKRDSADDVETPHI